MNCAAPPFAFASSREDIINSHLPLVEKLVDCARRRRDVRGVERDDMVSEARIALMEGVDSFDAGRGVELVKYVTHKIVFALLNFVRSEKRATSRLLSLSDLEEDDEPHAAREDNFVEMRAVIEQGIESLAENLRQPLRLHLLHEYSKADVARKLNLSERHVGRLIEQGITRIRASLATV